MVNQDPWASAIPSPASQSKNSSDYTVLAFSSTELKLPPKPLNYLTSVHLLAKPKAYDLLDIVLLFQYSDGDMWSVSLRQ